MNQSLRRPRIIRWLLLAAATLVLAACSVLRVGYNQGGDLVFWWLDGYVDLDGQQAPRVREAVDEWFAWHRATQLPDYAELLARAQQEVLAAATPQQVCRWADALQQRADAAAAQALPWLATLVLGLSPQQLTHMEQRFAKANDEFRDDFLQADPQRRQRAALKRAVGRFETLYGSLDRSQRERLAQWLAESPFDPERWFAERMQRQRDLMATIGALQALPAAQRTPQRVQQALAGQLEAFARSPRDDYRAYQQRLRDYNCDVIARLHNDTTPAQRQAAQARLRGWEDDARVLAAQNGR